MPHIEIRRTSKLNPESTYLRHFLRNVTSNNGEDGLIEVIFKMISPTNKWCVELGAHNGQFFSNSWNLIHHNGWCALLIEADPLRYQELKANYASNPKVHTLQQLVTTEASQSLETIFKQTDLPLDFDFLCLDVDGIDWHLWNSLENYRPRVVAIEFNPTIPNDIYCVQDNDVNIHHGSSLLALIELATQKGYQLVATTLYNAFFVWDELFPNFNIKDNSIDAMYEPAYESRIFQFFDGTLYLCGNDRLVWKDVPISQEDIQVLPVEERTFDC